MNFSLQAQILSQKIDNECKLHQRAQLLLTVSDEAMKDLNGKTNRKRYFFKSPSKKLKRKCKSVTLEMR